MHPAFFFKGSTITVALSSVQFPRSKLPAGSTIPAHSLLNSGVRTLPCISHRASIVALALLCIAPICMFAGDTPLTVEDLVRNHLDAIGTAQVRSATQSRAVQGTAVYRILVGGGGSVEGKTGMVSEGRKLRFMAKFPRGDYRGEQFVFNEGRFEIAFANVDQTRSAFADFVRTQTAILGEGLFGGVLSTGWALLDTGDRKPKLTYEGLKKVDSTSCVISLENRATWRSDSISIRKRFGMFGQFTCCRSDRTLERTSPSRPNSVRNDSG